MPGSIKLFRLFGIQVYLHWSWALIAIFQIQRRTTYDSVVWSAGEYLVLFAIVLMHEFGHALACRSVGGRAERIMLWPLGGVAFVEAPQRAGAQLWSIIAGPLVNLVLVVPTVLLAYLFYDRSNNASNLSQFFFMIALINIGLLIFNMLPIFPLDGGQVVRSLLWFFVGPIQSLKIATIIGLIGAAAGVAVAIYFQDIWLIVIAIFAGSQSWAGFKAASNASVAQPQIKLNPNYACPSCHQSPPAMPIWECANCHTPFDTFASDFTCPNCQTAYQETACPFCRNVIPKNDWLRRETV